jgi:CubicO group peptidase (beta-lactamase class C family)
MNILLISIALAGAALAPQEKKPQDKPDKKPPPVAPAFDTDKLTALVEELGKTAVAKEGVPGMSIAVAKDGEILVAKGFGYVDAARGVTASESTVYAIGSLTRQFTAVGILQLVDAKKLALEDELKKHLPQFPVGDNKVTIQHMLANTSGIPGWKKLLAKHPEIAKKELDEAAFFKLFQDVPFDFAPGEGFALDSANYVLLSMILSKASGENYVDYVRKHMIEPVGLARTEFCPDGKRPVGFGSDCREVCDDIEFEIPLPAAPEFATQSLCSTVGDIVKWQEALVQRAVFSERASRLIMTPTTLPDGNSTNYGYAIAMSKLGEFKSYSHTGGIGGFRVRVAYYSLPHVTIVVIANCATAPVDRVERDLARFVLAMQPPEVVDVAVPKEDVERCAGLYQIATTQIRVLAQDGKLFYETAGEKPVALLHQGNLVFALANDKDARVTFNRAEEIEKDKPLKCPSFVLMRGGFQSTGKRMD